MPLVKSLGAGGRFTIYGVCAALGGLERGGGRYLRSGGGRGLRLQEATEHVLGVGGVRETARCRLNRGALDRLRIEALVCRDFERVPDLSVCQPLGKGHIRWLNGGVGKFRDRPPQRFPEVLGGGGVEASKGTLVIPHFFGTNDAFLADTIEAVLLLVG